MDKLTYIQLDQIEENTKNILEQLSETTQVDILQSFYQEEIENEKGSLHHLATDEKLRDYMESIEQEPTQETYEDVKPGEFEGSRYETKPF